jgi:hypothetical protein
VHLVIARAEVELGEALGAVEFIEEVIDHWDQEFVLGRLVVESPVVDAEAPGVVRLPDEEDRAENSDVEGRMIPCSSILAH